MVDQLCNAGRSGGDAELVVLDLGGDADAHEGLLDSLRLWRAAPGSEWL
jgi:hypothetical protein